MIDTAVFVTQAGPGSGGADVGRGSRCRQQGIRSGCIWHLAMCATHACCHTCLPMHTPCKLHACKCNRKVWQCVDALQVMQGLRVRHSDFFPLCMCVQAFATLLASGGGARSLGLGIAAAAYVCLLLTIVWLALWKVRHTTHHSMNHVRHHTGVCAPIQKTVVCCAWCCRSFACTLCHTDGVFAHLACVFS